MSGHVAVVGSVNVDFVLRCRRLPRPGETVQGLGLSRTLGGKGANQAVAAARSGAKVRFIGAVGNDSFGIEAARALAADRVDVSHLFTSDGPTGSALILVDEQSGQNSIGVHAGANASLAIRHVESAAELIASAAILVCQLETPLAAVRRAMEIARRARVPVLLNPAPMSAPLAPELLQLVDILVPNALEAAALVKPGSFDERDMAAVARQLREVGVSAVVMTCGAEGVVYDTASEAGWSRAFEVQAVDTTGAGDTFIGAFVAARCRGEPMAAAIRWAQAAAAISVTRKGAMASIPAADEIATMLGC